MIITKAAYILFYKKKKWLIIQTSDFINSTASWILSIN